MRRVVSPVRPVARILNVPVDWSSSVVSALPATQVAEPRSGQQLDRVLGLRAGRARATCAVGPTPFHFWLTGAGAGTVRALRPVVVVLRELVEVVLDAGLGGRVGLLAILRGLREGQVLLCGEQRGAGEDRRDEHHQHDGDHREAVLGTEVESVHSTAQRFRVGGVVVAAQVRSARCPRAAWRACRPSRSPAGRPSRPRCGRPSRELRAGERGRAGIDDRVGVVEARPV